MNISDPPIGYRVAAIIDGVAYMMLSRCKALTVLDSADLPLVVDTPWALRMDCRTAYAISSKSDQLHRRLLPHAAIVDHINGNGLDNRRCNLRAVTPVQSALNRRQKSTNRSGFKGVHWNTQRLLWQATIQVDGRRTYLGFFTTPKAAAEAYWEAAQRLHGAFARQG